MLNELSIKKCYNQSKALHITQQHSITCTTIIIHLCYLLRKCSKLINMYYIYMDVRFLGRHVFPCFEEYFTFSCHFSVVLFCCVNQSLLHRQIGVDAFLEFSCFLEDTIGVNNLISDSPVLCKSRLNIWKLMVHSLLKLGLENFEQFFATLCCCCCC